MSYSDEFDYMYEFLKRTQKSRKYMDFPDWHNFEKLSMLAAVNEHRAELSREPRSLADIERVEQMASGHIDYTKKFALYCAELIHTDEVRP